MTKNVLILFFLFSSITFLGQQTYYNDVNINLTGLSLKNELATKVINTHTRFLAYTQVWDASKNTDVNPQNNQEVLLIYGWENGTDTNLKNDRTRAINNNGGKAGNWNREHVYAQSLGTPTLGEAGPGADAHHLRPADKDWNSTRNNRKFTDGSGNSGTRANGGWYPGDEWKGDVARMMMYMYLRYDDRCLPSNIGIGNNQNTPDDMIDLFLQWNIEDPVSDIERQRNTYHENISNDFAQGNRNPFIDNPILATRIWGGQKAEDTWGIYSSNDTEAPTTPTNLVASNETTFSIDLAWNAATDNVGVTSYDVFVDGNLYENTTSTSITVTNLNTITSYSFTVLAKDIVDNKSAQSAAIIASTLQDTEAPSVPSNITISNQTTSSFVISWDASSDNTVVDSYNVFLDGNKIASVSETLYTVTNLSIATTYSIQINAKDSSGNTSALSNSVNASTNGNNSTASEIFFSEYVEGSSNNKALEIVNLTNNNIDLSIYSIKRQQNGGKDGNGWDESNVLNLSGTLTKNDVYVIINGNASDQKLIDEADLIHPNASNNNWGAPINYNGNDPVGLFKNNILIDIIGTFDGGDSNFAKDKTIRRKKEVLSPNSTFNLTNEWDTYSKDTVDDIGTHSGITLSTETFSSSGIFFYPNPTKGNISIQNASNRKIEYLNIYNITGIKVFYQKNPQQNLNIKTLSKGIYMITFVAQNKVYKTRIIKN